MENSSTDTPPITIPQDDLLPVPAKPHRSGAYAKKMKKGQESIEQRAWFMEYVKLGTKRSLHQIARMSEHTTQTLEIWSRKYDWVKRAKEEDKKLLDTGDGLDTHVVNLKRKKLVLDIADYLIKHAAIIDEKTGEVTGAKINIKNVFDLRAVIDLRDEQLGLKDKNKAAAVQGTTNIDKAVFIIKK